MLAYKGFKKDLTCTFGQGIFQYEADQTMKEDSSKCQDRGLHCAENPLECLRWYPLGKGNRYFPGSYVNKDGQKVYTTEVIVDEQEFADSRGHSAPTERPAQGTDIGDGFMSIPEGIEDEGLPFT